MILWGPAASTSQMFSNCLPEEQGPDKMERKEQVVNTMQHFIEMDSLNNRMKNR